ncbi:polynucleotide 5'-kinase and 3'-phosphatase [Aeromonas phage Aswh_1]|nr:polynucleotide 5'-kinase and 3'-phosphatase [Aeromonas phage Aswh_1]
MYAYITIGASSSGKSTFAEAMVKTSQGKTVNVNRDDTRRSLFQIKNWKSYNFGKDREALVTEVNRGKVKAAAEAGKNVIISDTNLNEHLRGVMVKDLENMGYEVVFIWFPVSEEELKRRDKTRGGWAVGDVVLNRMIAQFNEQFERRNLTDRVCEETTKKQYEPDLSLPKAVIFDTDGTLAEKNDRNAFDWSKVGEDTPRENVVMLAKLLKEKGYLIINVSGRDGVCMEETAEWYDKHGIPNDAHFQREKGDQRPDNIIKEEIFWRDIAPRFNVCFCVDDRDQVVKTWRGMGLECWQVQPGDF